MSAGYTLQQIATIAGGTVIHGKGESLVENILLDSRKLILAEKACFFALKGPHHNGHLYLQDMYLRGVRNFVVTRGEPLPENIPEANIAETSDTLSALQKLAAYHRNRFSYPVVAITGSNGKTIVKEWLNQLLQPDFRIVRSPRSFNSQVGVPLSLWQMDESFELALIEAGISRKGEMEKLAEMIHPDIGIFTRIGPAHQENFSSTTEKIREKLRLFKSAKTLIYCKDHREIAAEIENTADSDQQLLAWSTKEPAALQITLSPPKSGKTELLALWQGKSIPLWLPFTDPPSVENALHCLALALYLQVSETSIADRLQKLTPVAMRLELLNGINDCTLINDVYNSDLNSLEMAVDLLSQQQQHSKNTVILSDIAETGLSEASLYQKVANLLKAKKIHRLIGIGPELSRQASRFQIPETAFYPNTESFLQALQPVKFTAENILLKGARKFEFERISSALQQKAHETILEINLSHLVHNLNVFRQQLEPATSIMAMVKASSYGSGSVEIANVLQFNRVAYLGVAFADEGVELRRAGISLPIVVMNPEATAYESMVHYDLEPQIYNSRTLRGFAGALRRTSATGSFPIHLKLDTGMNRVGYKTADLEELASDLKQHPELQVKSIFSHLSGSDNPALDDFTRQQIATFEAMYNQLVQILQYRPMRHILNSSGISRFPEAHYEMVRLGIGLYGIGNSGLLPTTRLLTTISQVKKVEAGESVGYNRAEVLKKDSRIAILPIGYADGLRRSLGNRRGKVWVNGHLVPFVGSICMDMSMIDISGISCKEGDQVEIFGQHQSLSEFSKALDTIEYEVLSTISHRVKRVYLQE